MTYPYLAPIILTDDIYSSFGGHTGSTTPFQRQSAYLIAEEKVSNAIGTLLRPTIVTGTYAFVAPTFSLEWNRVIRLIKTSFTDFSDQEVFSVLSSNNGVTNIRNYEYGILDVDGSYMCHIGLIAPYKIQVVYEAGLSSGTSYHPNILLALTTIADMTLNEIVGYGNESVGNIGIQSYSNQEYSEQRVLLRNTNFGSSPRAMFADGLLTDFKVRSKGVGL